MCTYTHICRYIKATSMGMTCFPKSWYTQPKHQCQASEISQGLVKGSPEVHKQYRLLSLPLTTFRKKVRS